MITRISEIIHEWMGWCPNTQPQMHTRAIRPDDEAVVSSAGGSFKDHAINWFGLFRNQTILQTIGTFCIGLFMFAGLGDWSNLNLFIIGMLAGLPYSAIVAIWYWRIFNKVLHVGPIVLWNRYDKTAIALTVVTLVVSISVWVLVLFGAIPGVDLAMTEALFGGFIAVLFWGVLIAIHHWESGTHRRLHYDGMILTLEKEG